MKTFDELVETLGATDIKNMAFKKKKVLTKEFKKIVKTIKKVDLQTITDLPAVETIKDNLSMVFDKVQDSVQDIDVVEYAMHKVSDTKDQVFSALNIPSQNDVQKLTRKLVSLEKKLQTVTKHVSKRK